MEQVERSNISTSDSGGGGSRSTNCNIERWACEVILSGAGAAAAAFNHLYTPTAAHRDCSSARARCRRLQPLQPTTIPAATGIGICTGEQKKLWRLKQVLLLTVCCEVKTRHKMLTRGTLMSVTPLDSLAILTFCFQFTTRRMYRRRASIQECQASTSAWWRHCSETVFPR